MAAIHRASRPSGGPGPASRSGGRRYPLVLAWLLVSLTVVAGARPAAAHRAEGPAYRNPDLPVAWRVADLLGRMTLEEKVGQMTQGERGSLDADPALITRWGLGSVLSGGGSVPTPNTPAGWADMVDRFQQAALNTRLGIPIIYGVDAVHGHGNLQGATIFPHNVGMGATRDPALVAEAGHITAQETRATGVPWVFAPCLCVVRDERWGRSYESFGEHPWLVQSMETVIDGLQGDGRGDLASSDRVLATAKHFAGDGDTTYGTGSGDYPIDQGVTEVNRFQFALTDLSPYAGAVWWHHVGSVMPSFSSVDWTEDGLGNPIKMHQNGDLITGYLKGLLGFRGFVISDWEGIHQLPGDWATQVRTAVNAGMDMAMEPTRFGDFATTLLDEVRAGRVSEARVDDAVRRILTAKFELGLFERPFADRSGQAAIGSPAHRAVARRAVAESQVLLKNDGGTLPLSPASRVYVAGRNAHDMGNQAGGWTLTWQGFSGNEGQQPGTTILEGIRQATPNVVYSADATAPVGDSDVGIVVVGETPYAEGFGDVGGPLWAYDPADAGQPREPKSLTLAPSDQAAIDRVCGQIETCVVLVVSGRPQVLGARGDRADAVVASWLPGTEGGGVADVLFGRRPFTGRLPVSWPASPEQEPVNIGDPGYAPQYPFGWGLRTGA
jgi:beta-glucosidase